MILHILLVFLLASMPILVYNTGRQSSISSDTSKEPLTSDLSMGLIPPQLNSSPLSQMQTLEAAKTLANPLVVIWCALGQEQSAGRASYNHLLCSPLLKQSTSLLLKQERKSCGCAIFSQRWGSPSLDLLHSALITNLPLLLGRIQNIMEG